MSGYSAWVRASTSLVVGFPLQGSGTWTDQKIATIERDGRLQRFEIGHDKDTKRLFGLAVPLAWCHPNVAEADPAAVQRAFNVVQEVMDLCDLEWPPMARVVMDGR